MSGLSLYEQVLGADYGRLPAAVQRFHRLRGHSVLHGWVEIGAPASALARGLAWCLGAPRAAGSGPLRFELQAGPDTETWTRHFPAHTMRSRLRLAGGQLEERLGPARLSFELSAAADRLEMALVKMRCFGLPCPSWLLPRLVAQEKGIDEQLHFEVSASVPLIGVVTRYRGHLELHPKGPRP
jgi:Domain of unknown function (DUF4166)